MANLSPEHQFDLTKERVQKSVEDYFPIVGNQHTINLNSAVFNDNLSSNDVTSQKKARQNNQTWGAPLVGDLELVDNKSGDVLSKSRMNLLRLPKITREYTYIVRGQGRYVQNQFRLKSGVYAKRRQNGKLTSQFNLRQGVGFSLDMHDNGHMMLSYPTGGGSKKNIHLYPVLRAMGMSDDDISSQWGADTLAINRSAITSGKGKKDKGANEIYKMYEALNRKKPENMEEAIQGIKASFATTELYGDTTKKTLGKAFTSVSGDLLTTAAAKLYRVARDEDVVDNLEDLGFKEVWSVEDHIPEKIKNSRREIMRRVKNNLDKKTDVRQIMSPGTFNLPVKSFFTQDTRTLLGSQINPLSMLSDQRQTTLMGSGGITSEDQIIPENTLIDKTHLGFLDPTHTPESKRTGVVQHLPMGVVKQDNKLLTPIWDAKKKSMSLIDPIKLHDNNKIAYPDQFKWKDGKPTSSNKTVWADVGGERQQVSLKSVDYILPSAPALMGPISSAVPFVNQNHGARIMMSGRQMGQAIPMVRRQAPLVQSNAGNGKSVEEVYGEFASHTSPTAGTITRITKDNITISGKKGKDTVVPIYNNYPLNDAKVGVFMHAEPLVKVGDKVKSGQTLADTNYTKDGVLAMGRNMLTAFMPSGGENFEDGVVISQSAADEMTSPHLYRFTTEISKDTTLNKRDFLRYYKDAMTHGQQDKLDDTGVIKVGQELTPGDTIMSVLRKSTSNTTSGSLQKMKKVLFRPMDDKSEIWDKDATGKVVDVVRKGKYVTAYVRTEEPMREGDKLSGRHGNKGIVVKVKPDEDMPHTKDGRAVKVLMNPTTVPTRMNLGQVSELAAGKIAEKTGKPYVADHYHGFSDRSKDLAAELDKHNGVPTEELFDKDGTSLGQIGIGPQYILKLHQQIEKKQAVRGRGAYDINEAPKRGGKTGAQKMDQYGLYALLAHGARDLIKEKATYTSNRNDSLWEAIEGGMPIPPPQQSFAVDKFKAYLRGVGLNLEKRGHKLKMLPFMDSQIEKLSAGELRKPWLQLFGDKEEVGGLFDRHLTGGLNGSKWSHMTLSEPVINPLFFKGAVALTGLKRKELIDLSVGEKGMKDGKLVAPETEGATTGGAALYSMLNNLDVKGELASAKGALENASASARGPLINKVKYLRALDNEKLPATSYMLKRIPVMPPKFRPVLATDDNSPFRSSLNGLYKYVGLTNHQLKTFHPLMPLTEKTKLRRSLLGQVWKLFGGESRPYKEDRSIIPRENEDTLGILELIAGKKPKEGFFQDKLVSKRQDLSMRTTITVGADLDMDEVGLPKKSALKMFTPLVKAELKRRGLARKAQDMIDSGDPQAYKALEHVMRRKNGMGQEEFHPVLLKRDPALHAFSVMAYKPVLVDGDAIRLHPLSCEGFNADFDGDQMAAFVPVSPGGIEEAKNMLPSKKLFNTTHGEPAHKPSQEAVWGLYHMSKWGKKTNKSYKNRDAAQQALSAGKINMDDVVGVGDMRTTAGRLLIDDMLPESMRGGEHLTNPEYVINKSRMRGMLHKVAREFPKEYPRTVQSMLKQGNHVAYRTGRTISIKDLSSAADVRDPLLKAAHKKAAAIRAKKGISKDEKRERVIGVYNDATDSLLDAMNNKFKDTDNAIYHMNASGARGSVAQMRQMLGAPMLVQDGLSRTRENPVTRSYAEGLDFGSHWETQHGARKGIVQRATGTSDPGAMSKKIINTTMHQIIGANDCGTTEGLLMKANDPHTIGRYLGKSVSADGHVYEAGTLVDKDLQKSLTKGKDHINSIVVRSPLKCEHNDGICSKCFGLNEEGKLHNPGVNIGVIAGQAIGEPLSQGSMNAFHEGGVAKGGGAKSVSQFERATQLTTFPSTLPNATTLGMRSGKVSNVRKSPTGGFLVTVDGKDHKTQFRPTVKDGDIVKRGQSLSPGFVNPRELMQAHGPKNGIKKVRAYLTDELSQLFRTNPYNRKNVEVVVKSLTDLAEVVDPGNASGVTHGDYLTTPTINKLNKEQRADIKSVPVLKGVNVLPLVQTEDFLARANYEKLKSTFTDAALQGWESDIHGSHPIPALVWGKEFGKGTPDKPWAY